MSQVMERYLQEGPRPDTRRSYLLAVEHFEVNPGGWVVGCPYQRCKLLRSR
jgi:hypothetical protein